MTLTTTRTTTRIPPPPIVYPPRWLSAGAHVVCDGGDDDDGGGGDNVAGGNSGGDGDDDDDDDDDPSIDHDVYPPPCYSQAHTLSAMVADWDLEHMSQEESRKLLRIIASIEERREGLRAGLQVTSY
jgi:hypothetical protein